MRFIASSLFLLALQAFISFSSSFIVKTESQRSSLVVLTVSQGGFGDGQRKQEKYMEAMSLQGAEEIAKMNISERASRALLAEAMEDRIFQLQDDLEELSGGQVPVDESVKAQCVDIAKDIRRFQIQYNDLVSGAPSELLDSMKSWKTEQNNNVDADGSTFD
jgi:hypothetical protein